MQEYEVKRDGARDLRFVGEELAQVQSSPHDCDANFSRSVGRWTELTLYQTKGGKYVAAERRFTLRTNEVDRFAAAVCDTGDDVVEYLGTGWLAKWLYSEAGLDTAEEVA